MLSLSADQCLRERMETRFSFWSVQQKLKRSPWRDPTSFSLLLKMFFLSKITVLIETLTSIHFLLARKLLVWSLSELWMYQGSPVSPTVANTYRRCESNALTRPPEQCQWPLISTGHQYLGFSYDWNLLDVSRYPLGLFEANEKNPFTGYVPFPRQFICEFFSH